jgi:hypothetical protein
MILQPPSAHPEVSQTIAGFTDLSPKPPRSKLEPHRELIRELRRKGQTYRDIARIFGERLNLSVTPSTIHSFVKVRAKHRKQVQFELPPATTEASSPGNGQIAALKAKPTAQGTKRTRFVFHENEPLTLTISGGEQ